MILVLLLVVFAVAWFSFIIVVHPPARIESRDAKSDAPAGMDLDEAARMLYRLSGKTVAPRDILSDVARYQSAYRRAAARLHPDVNGGIDDGEQFYRLQEAKTILDAHYGR